MAVLENYNITAKALNKDEEEERWIVSLVVANSQLFLRNSSFICYLIL
jgi:hypothetical protein